MKIDQNVIHVKKLYLALFKFSAYNYFILGFIFFFQEPLMTDENTGFVTKRSFKKYGGVFRGGSTYDNL